MKHAKRAFPNSDRSITVVDPPAHACLPQTRSAKYHILAAVACRVRFVSIPSLIRMKEIAGRPQDKIDID